MPNSYFKYSAALEPRHFLNTQLYLSSLPIMLVASVGISIRDLTVSSLLGYTAANLISLALCAAMFFVIGKSVFKSTLETRRLWQVVLFGMVLGTTKFLSTSWLVAALGLERDLGAALESRVGTPLLGVWAVLVVGFVSSAREQFKQIRERLISERVAKSMQAEQPMSQLGVEQLEEFLLETKSLIANQPRSELSGKQLAILIRQIVDTGLRPLSHKLWEKEDRSLPNFAAKALMQRAISNSPYPLTAVLCTIALSNFGGNFREATFTQGLAHFAIQILLVAVVVIIANRVKGILSKDNFSRVIQLVLVSSAAAFSSSMVPELLIPTQNTANLWLVSVISSWWIAVVLVGVGAVSVAIRDNRAQLEMLESLLREDVEIQAVRSQTLLADRELANHLHSNIQNQLLAQALRVETSGHGELEAELDNLDRILAQAKLLSQPKVNLDQGLSELKARWQGLVQLQIGPVTGLEPAHAKTVLALVNEAIGNAFRHGYANQVSVSFARSETELTVLVKDNGLGPRGSAPGLGSLLYDSCGSWTLTAGADGGSELVIKISLAQ